MKPSVHWLGGVDYARGRRLPGWPCCCAGDVAEKISHDGARGTRNPLAVTCKACLNMMRKDDHADRFRKMD
jgi:hypothetical protein